MRSRNLAARVAACIAVVVAGLGSGAAGALASDPAPARPPGGASPTVAEWIDRHAHPLVTTEPADPVGDLRPLRRVAAGASVVGLGEANHGSHEQFGVKHRMVRFLVAQQGLIDTAGDLVSFVAGLPAPGDRLEHEYAVQHARAIHGWYEYYEELGGFRPTRGHDIAETILWWQGLTGHRVAFWAASAHVTSASELTYRDPAPQHGTMAGGLLERRLGRRYVAIGTLFHQGTISSDYGQPGPHRIRPPGPGLLESTLVAASSPAYVLPLPNRAPGVVGHWLAGEATMRMIHPAYREGEDPDAYTMTVPSLREAFDALVFVRHTTASRLIGG